MFEIEKAKKMLKAYSLSGQVIDLGIVVVVLAVLVGAIAFPIFFGTNTTGWGTTNILVWGVIPTVTLAAIIIGVVKHFKGGGE